MEVTNGIPIPFTHMRKILALFLTLALLLAGIPAVYAQTADHADLTVEFTPTENQNGQIILEMNVTVHNGETGQYISSLEFRYENSLIASFDTVAAQSTAFARSNSLGMSLGAMTSDLEIEVTYVDFNGDDVYRTMTVSYENAEPKLSLKRTASATSAAQGEKIRLTYILKNEGNVPLVDLQLYDDMEEIGQIDTVDQLAPGDMRQFTVDVKMTRDVKSQPRVSYRAANASQSTVLVLEAMDLVIYQPKLTVTLKSDVSAIQAGASVTLVCNVVNEGNVAFSNATISDSTLGNLIEGTRIEVGKAYSWNKLIRPVDSQNYMVTVKAVDENGQTYTATSNIVSVKVSAPEQTDAANLFTVTATPNTNTLDQPGEVLFNLLLRNGGQSDLTNITVSDQNNNVLERINSMSPGDRLVTISVNVTQSGDYFFVVDGTTDTGEKVQSITEPAHVTVGMVAVNPESQGAPATPTPTPLTINSDEKGGMAPWLLMLLIFVVLLIVACIVVLVILQLRANRRRDDEEEDYVPPQEPVQPRRAPNQDPYDYREEISRVATEYSRPAQSAQSRRAPQQPSRPAAPTPRQVPDFDEDDETPTVYKSRPSSEPSTKRND